MLALCVDDNDLSLEAAFLALEKEGIQYQSSKSGKDALARIKELKPDVVILDIKMKGMNGLEVCKKIKSDPELKNIHVMIVSGSEDIVKAKAFGADSWYEKPFLPSELAKALRAIAAAHNNPNLKPA